MHGCHGNVVHLVYSLSDRGIESRSMVNLRFGGEHHEEDERGAENKDNTDETKIGASRD